MLKNRYVNGKISKLEYSLVESESIIQPRFEKCFFWLNIASASPCLYWGKGSFPISNADLGRYLIGIGISYS